MRIALLLILAAAACGGETRNDNGGAGRGGSRHEGDGGPAADGGSAGRGGAPSGGTRDGGVAPRPDAGPVRDGGSRPDGGWRPDGGPLPDASRPRDGGDLDGGGACQGPNPQGCSSTGCPAGQQCLPTDRCIPSACGCDPATGGWICTTDCNGGLCAPVGDGGTACWGAWLDSNGVCRTPSDGVYPAECCARDAGAGGQFCGGIAGIPCPPGFMCVLEGTFPDAGGRCEPARDGAP